MTELEAYDTIRELISQMKEPGMMTSQFHNDDHNISPNQYNYLVLMNSIYNQQLSNNPQKEQKQNEARGHSAFKKSKVVAKHQSDGTIKDKRSGPKKELKRGFGLADSEVKLIMSFLQTKDLLLVKTVCKMWSKLSAEMLLLNAVECAGSNQSYWFQLVGHFFDGHVADALSNQCDTNHHEESEHSVDIDRTFLTYQSEQVEIQAKLDKVLKALANSFPYFQGLNYICAAFISVFEMDLSYKCLRLLLKKVEYFPVKLQKLKYLSDLIHSIVKKQLPRLEIHLNSLDLPLYYFTTRWFLTLFSFDTEIEDMLKLWMLICLSSVEMLVCFTVSMLQSVEKLVLNSEEEDINHLLKFNLKTTISQMDMHKLMRDCVSIYMSHFTSREPYIDVGSMDELGGCLPTKLN